jgi:hypothetical protein
MSIGNLITTLLVGATSFFQRDATAKLHQVVVELGHQK